MQFKSFLPFVAVCGALFISGCGGGGGSNSPAVANTDAQGYWTGVSGYTVNMAVLENGEVWGIYSAGSTIYGGMYGTSTVAGSTFTVSGTDFIFPSNTSFPGSLTGPIVAKSTLTLSNRTGSIPLRYVASYDTPATAEAMAGTWSFTGRSGSYTLIPATITISNSGTFTLAQTGCTSSGSVVPRPGGKNIYNITLTATGTACATGQSLLSGVLNIDTTVTPNRFLALALTPSKNDGLIVIGTKQ